MEPLPPRPARWLLVLTFAASAVLLSARAESDDKPPPVLWPDFGSIASGREITDRGSGSHSVSLGPRLPGTVAIPEPAEEAAPNGAPALRFRFDPADLVEVSPSEQIERLLSGDFTLAVWVRLDGAAAQDGVSVDLFNTWMFQSRREPSLLITLDWRKGSLYTTVTAAPKDGSEFQRLVAGEDVRIRDNEWHHLAIVREGNTLRFYLDSVEGTDPAAIPDLSISSLPVYIGGSSNRRYGIPLLMADYRLYDRALSQTEIVELFEDKSSSAR